MSDSLYPCYNIYGFDGNGDGFDDCKIYFDVQLPNLSVAWTVDDEPASNVFKKEATMNGVGITPAGIKFVSRYAVGATGHLGFVAVSESENTSRFSNGPSSVYFAPLAV